MNLTMKDARFVMLVAVILGLAACGGGGSSNPPSSGDDSVTYDIVGSASPSTAGVVGGSGSYSGGQPITLTATPNPGHTFVDWTEEGSVVSDSSSYTFNVSSNRSLIANFEASPIADAGDDITVTPDSLVTLDGSGSSYAGVGSLTFSWSLVSRPYGSAASLSDALTGAPSFVADLHGIYTLSLSVSDGTKIDTDTVQVTATPVIETRVDGIIMNNTTWTLDQSPYEVSDRIQVADGATLTIQPGVLVYGGQNCTGGHCKIEVFGSLTAIGAPEENIGLHSLDIFPSGTGTAPLRVAYARMRNTALYVTSLKNSVIAGAWVQPSRCNTGCEVSENVVIGGPVIASVPVQITNNTFYDYHIGFASSAYAIEATNQSAVISGNTFASTDRMAVRIGNNDIDLTGNYWGTTNQETIGQMISDRNDDLNILGFGYFDPFLLEPDPNAPSIGPFLP